MISYIIGQLVTNASGVYKISKTRVRSYDHSMIPETVVNDYKISLRLTNENPIIIGSLIPQSNIDAKTLSRVFNGDIDIETLSKYRNIFNSSFTILGGNYTDKNQLEELLDQNMTVKGKQTKWMVGF